MTMTSTSIQAIRGYVAGTWVIDTEHSKIGFSVRHVMISRTRGKFTKFSGELVTTPDVLSSSVTAQIDMASIDTSNQHRDAHLRAPEFFDVDNHPQMTYRSTALHLQDGHYVLQGELTIKGVTKDVPLTLEVNGFGPNVWGGIRAGFTATGQINRRDFGIEAGGVAISDKVTIHLEIEAVLQA